ncbi:unnamed protein product [Adineta steineri]|uniref:Uncharacterized protein n=1 Tax=Adineta steineri TaxID=433720 RepID=A0A818KBL7_9BILA|nr:unnamed protein product [Adineta steineri]CAF3553671.1 unnamed protein product [Adineta steineri]
MFSTRNMNRVQIISYLRKKLLLRYVLIGSLISFEVLYILFKPNITEIETVVKPFVRFSQSSNNLCHRPDGTTFMNNQLQKLDINETDHRSAYINESYALRISYISKNYTTLSEFIENTRIAIMSRRLIPKARTLDIIFHHPPYKDMIKPFCDGLWMEFGVFQGATLSQIAKWKSTYCSNISQLVYGFDTFTGLPTGWRPGYPPGSLSIPNGTKISVPLNAVLVKGLFIDTLPTQLRLLDLEYRCTTPVSFVHIDSDTYSSARDVLFLLGTRFVPGTIIIFDELFNYPSYEKHEIKALFEFLSSSNLRFIPLGATDKILKKPLDDEWVQSFGFVVDFEELS